MRLPRSLLVAMRGQYGLLTRRHILEAGVSPPTLRSWVSRGHLEAVEDGVYRLPGSATTDEQRLQAAVLRAGDRACLTGWSACALYGLEGFDLRARAWVAIPSCRRARGVDFIVQRTDVAPGEVAIMNGIATAVPHRALVDAAMRVTPRAARVGIDDGRRRGMIDLQRLLRLAVRLGNHPGAVAVRRLFASGSLDQDGELERQLALVLHDVGLQPAWGMEVLPGIVVDACFPDASYVLECDGRRWHSIDSDRAADVSREGALVADGWLVHRVTSSDLRNRRDRLARGSGRHDLRVDAPVKDVRPGGVRSGRAAAFDLPARSDWPSRS